MPTILALSDIHGKETTLRSILEYSLNSYRIDAISVSGDITHFGSFEDLNRILQIISEAGRPFFYVLGNCDPPELKGGIDTLGICIESRCYKIGEITIVGSGGSTPTPFDTPFEVGEDVLIQNIKRAYSSCGGAVTYLVTHNPPLGSVVDLTASGIHAGSKALRELILNMSPSVAQCGHIHEARGRELIGGTLVFNPGPARRGNYAIVRLDGGDVDVQLGTV